MWGQLFDFLRAGSVHRARGEPDLSEITEMDQEQAKDSQSALLQRWIDVLHRWEEKRTHYQIELDKSIDPDHKQELEQGIVSCDQVIQTSQGLIQALSDRNSQPPPNTNSLAEQPSSVLSQDLTQQLSNSSSPSSTPKIFIPNVPPSSPLTVEELTGNSQESLPPAFSENHSESSSPQQLRSIPKPLLVPEAPTQPRSLQPVLKRILKVGLPLFIIAATGLAAFRPKNICKLAPGGGYSNTGLALWVQQALKDTDSTSAQTVSIGQYGCTIVLKGTVKNQVVQRNIIRLTKDIKLPSQAPIDQFKRALGLETVQVKPVQGVVSKLKVMNPNEQS